MPNAIIFAATEISALAADAAAAAGASSAVIEGVSTLAYSLATASITTGITYGIGALFAPKMPDAVALQTPLKQSMPLRQSAFGRVRVAGAYALFTVGTTNKGISYDVLALLDGRSNAVVSYYLNDDMMAQQGAYYWAPGAPGKYGGGGSNPPNLVTIASRLGLATETAYAISADVPVWTADHRGDGVTSLLLTCTQAKREDQPEDFPNGLPQPSAVIDAQLIFDPRDGAQTQGTASTYTYADNAFLCLLAYLTDAAGGMGLDYARFIAPALTEWTTALNEADGLVYTSGMHATLLDAAAAGDSRIFLSDTTGLGPAMTITLPTESVTVTSMGSGGEVFTSGLTYAHAAGELASWPGSGQQARYRCWGTYSHDTPPGDVVKSILAACDGWLGQRGDGVLVPRTNTVAPSVSLGDRHIVGYQVQHYLPDEQATNQYIVSFTDPASSFNKGEAGYVQDDADIAARGQLRSQPLDLQWVPSAPQAIAVARAMLARSTQPLRGTVTCNLAGLAVLGERFVTLEVSELAALNGVTVEITGKPSIDLSAMTVTFPFVAAGSRATQAAAICFALDISTFMAGAPLTMVQTAMTNALALVGAAFGLGSTLDISVVAFGTVASVTQSITRRGATASDIADIIAWVNALTATADNSAWSIGAAGAAGLFGFTPPDVTTRTLVFLTHGVPTLVGTTLYPGQADAAQAYLEGPDNAGVASYAINIINPDTTYTVQMDNTQSDGVPVATSADELTTLLENILLGSVSSAGAGYAIGSVGPASGGALQPLAVPTISSVTPDYPAAGGNGIQGARLSIVVSDEGDVSWKVRWKISTDTVWTELNVSDPARTPPTATLLTGLVAASGTLDVQAAYVTANQVSPWSATATVAVSAPTVNVTTTSVAAAAVSAGPGYMYDVTGTAKVIDADATEADPTSGSYAPCNCWILASAALGATVSVAMPGQFVAQGSLSPGATYWLAAGGGVTASAPSSSGNLDQIVGVADAAGTHLFFAPQRGLGV